MIDIASENQKIQDWVFSQETRQTLSTNSDEDQKTIWREELVRQLARVALSQATDIFDKELQPVSGVTPRQPDGTYLQQTKELKEIISELLKQALDKLVALTQTQTVDSQFPPKQNQQDNELLQVQLEKAKGELPRLERQALLDLKMQALERAVTEQDIIIEWQNHKFEPEFKKTNAKEIDALNAVFQKEMESLQAEVFLRDETIGKLKDDLELKIYEADDLANTVKGNEERIAGLQDALEQKEDEFANLQREIEQMQDAEDVRPNSPYTDFMEVEEALDLERSRLEADNNELEAQLDDANQELLLRTNIEAQLAQKIADERKKHVGEIDQLSLSITEQAKRLLRRQEELTGELHKKQDELSVLQKKRAQEATEWTTSFNTSFNDLERKIADKTAWLDQISAMQTKELTLHQELSEAREKLSKIEGEKSVHEREVQALKTKLNKWKHLVKERDEELDELEKQVDQLDASRKKLKNKIAKAQQEKTAAENQMALWKEQIRRGRLIPKTDVVSVATQTDPPPEPQEAPLQQHGLHRHSSLTIRHRCPISEKKRTRNEMEDSDKQCFASFHAWAKGMDEELKKLQDQLNTILGTKKYSPYGDEGPWVQDGKERSGQILGKFNLPGSPLHNATVFKSSTPQLGLLSDKIEKTFIVVAKQLEGASIDTNSKLEQTFTTLVTDNYVANPSKKVKTSEDDILPLRSPKSPKKTRNFK